MGVDLVEVVLAMNAVLAMRVVLLAMERVAQAVAVLAAHSEFPERQHQQDSAPAASLR